MKLCVNEKEQYTVLYHPPATIGLACVQKKFIHIEFLRQFIVHYVLSGNTPFMNRLQQRDYKYKYRYSVHIRAVPCASFIEETHKLNSMWSWSMCYLCYLYLL